MAEKCEKPITGETLERIGSLESELHTLRREADEASRLATLGLLSATIAHELRNVLTPVLNYARIAQARPDDPEIAQKAIVKAIEGVQTAADILDSTLEFAGATDSNMSRISSNVRDIVDKSLECLTRDPARDGIDLQVSVPPDLTASIRPLALQQVLMNLLLNAFRALTDRSRGAPHRPKRVTISAEHEPTRDLIIITVSDTGPGFPTELAANLFKPFVSGSADGTQDDDTNPNESGTGTGLGLAICKRLTTEAGGTIRAASSPGEGATFTIELPHARTTMKKAG